MKSALWKWAIFASITLCNRLNWAETLGLHCGGVHKCISFLGFLKSRQGLLSFHLLPVIYSQLLNKLVTTHYSFIHLPFNKYFLYLLYLLYLQVFQHKHVLLQDLSPEINKKSYISLIIFYLHQNITCTYCLESQGL